jgi:phosphate transport system protein
MMEDPVAVHFMQETEHLKRQISDLGRTVVEMLETSVGGLLSLDPVIAAGVIEQDREIDDTEVRIEEECLKLIALYQPVAGDLRFITTCMKVNDALERVADHAVNLAGLTRELTESGAVSFPPRVAELAGAVARVCEDTLDAFLRLNRLKAVEICRGDDRIDALDAAVSTEALEIGRDNVAHALLIARVGHELERVGDLMTNIAEDTIYLVTGQIVRHRMEDAQTGPARPTSAG